MCTGAATPAHSFTQGGTLGVAPVQALALSGKPTPGRAVSSRRRRRSIMALAEGDDTLGLPGTTPTAKPTYGA